MPKKIHDIVIDKMTSSYGIPEPKIASSRALSWKTRCKRETDHHGVKYWYTWNRLSDGYLQNYPIIMDMLLAELVSHPNHVFT